MRNYLTIARFLYETVHKFGINFLPRKLFDWESLWILPHFSLHTTAFYSFLSSSFVRFFLQYICIVFHSIAQSR